MLQAGDEGNTSMTKQTSRREFLRVSAAVSGGLAFAGQHPLRAQIAPGQGALSASGETAVAHAFAFDVLPPGAVEPRGWLRSWAQTAANGITGHLDEYCATFHEAWRGYGFQALGANPDGTGWPLEQCSYWLDGAIRLGYMLGDQQLIQKVSARLDGVVNGVLQGGETFIYWLPVSAVRDSFNSWAHSHMGRALVAYHLGSGDPKVLEALVKVYRTYPLDDLPETFKSVSGAVNLDAMSDTYRLSRDPQILENMLAFAHRKSYQETADRWAAGELEFGHNVIFYEDIRIPAVLYPWTGSARDFSATVAGLHWNDAHSLLPMGVSSGEEYHAGIGSTRNVETCDVAASIWTNLCLARISGDSEYFDRVEQVFLNAGPAPVSKDFKTMSYYQRPNRFSTKLPGQEPANPGKGSYQFTEIGDPVLCCVGNLNRIIPNFVMHMWMATPDGGLAAALYGPSHLTSTVNGNVRISIDTVTAYPFEETIEMQMSPEHDVRFPLHLRIPAWTQEPQILINGRPWRASLTSGSFQTVLRDWTSGDRVQLHFPMRIHVLKGYEAPYPQIPYFKNSRAISQIKQMHNPYASVYYGPLLFSLPIPAKSPNQEVPGIKANYAISVGGSHPGPSEAEVFRVSGFPYDQWQWSLSTPLQLGINAHEIAWTPTELQPLPDRLTTGTRTRIVLVPYGCTKFGVSMFPRTT
jgi:uncharacterized protein